MINVTYSDERLIDCLVDRCGNRWGSMKWQGVWSLLDPMCVQNVRGVIKMVEEYDE